MVVAMQKEDLVLFLIMTSVAMVIALGLILAHLLIKQFRKPPGGLILWDFISTFIVTLSIVA